MIRGRVMESIGYLAVLVLTISSILSQGASAEDTELDRLSDQPEPRTEWNNEKLMMDFQVLCNNGTLITPGEFAPGVNLTTFVQTFRSVWRANSLADVATIVCKRYGPLLNLMSGGVARTVCEPIIDAMNQDEPVSVEDTCYQLWDTFQHGSAISSVPSCPAWGFNEDVYDYWDDYNYYHYPSDDKETSSDGHREHHVDPSDGHTQGYQRDDEKDGYHSGERDKPDVYPTGYPKEDDWYQQYGFTEGYPYGGHDDDDEEFYFHFDIWKIKKLVEAAFSFVDRGSGDLCFNITEIVFNKSISSFDVIDHALSAFLMTKLEEVKSNCGSTVEFLSPTASGMDFTATFLSHISESLGTNDLCSALTGFKSATSEFEIIDMAKMKIFDGLKDIQACLDIYDTLAEFAEDISKVTGMESGHQLCEMIVGAFTRPGEVKEGSLNFEDRYGEFYYYLYWEWPLYAGDILPGVPFYDAIGIAANVLNSDTAAHGLSVVCRAFSKVMDHSKVEACNALNETNYHKFLESCYSSNTWPEWMFPTKDRHEQFPHFLGLDFLNNMFSTFHLLKEKASQFNPDIDPHVHLFEFIPPYDSVGDGDVCSAVGNLLFNKGLTFGDILLPIIEKHLLFLYHVAPHYCQVPLDPGYQWPGQDYEEDHGDPWDGGKDDPNNEHKDPDETGVTYETPWVWGTTQDAFMSGNRKNKRDAQEVTESPFDWEETTMDLDYTTWDWGKPYYPGKDDHYDGHDPWWDIKIGILHGKLLKDILAVLSGNRNYDEFCRSTLQKFEHNETAYHMDGEKAVLQMKEKLLGVLYDYSSCVSTSESFMINLTDTEFYQMTGFQSSGSLCQAVSSAFTSGATGSLFGNISNFEWPIDYPDYGHYDGLPTSESQPGELAPGVYLSTFIEFAGLLYDADIREATAMICHSFQHFLGYFEGETCQFLESAPSQEEFVRYCNDRGDHNNDNGHDDDNNHHGHHDDDRHEGVSIFDKLPWNELPNIVADIWGTTLESVPMCGLGWELYSEQPVKLILRSAFQTLTRLLLHATNELECDSDDDVMFSNYTHDVFDHFYRYDYDFTVEEMESDDFLGLLYSFLGGYNNSRDLCHDVQSLAGIPELLLQIEEHMTNTLFEIVEDKDTCKSFLDTLSDSLGEDFPAGATVGQMAGFASNTDFCGNVTNYMAGSFDFTFNSTALVVHLENIEEMDILNPEVMDNILRVVAIIYRAENIKEISETFCPILELAPHLDPELEIMEACTFLLTVNDTTFDGICTDTLQCYIPYFWLSLNSRGGGLMMTDHRNKGDHYQHDYDWYDYGTTFDHHYDHYNGYGYYGDYDMFSHMSFQSLGPIFSHVLGFPLLDSRVTCSGIDNWLQASEGSEIFDSMFRFIQMFIISDSENICPTIYYYGSQRPHRQPDLQYGDTSFKDVIGAVNQFLGNYSDYETLCWDAQVAYQEWQYFGDSSRLDSMLDKMVERLMAVLNDKDQCVEFADSMNRMPIYGPVAAWLGFETNEKLCQEVTYYFSEDRETEINVSFLLSLIHFEEDETKCWTTEMKLAVTEVVKLVSKVYHYDAVSTLDQICEIALDVDVNGILPAEMTMICQHISTEGSILNPCLEIVSRFIDNTPFFDEDFRGNQTSNWRYLEGVFTKLGQLFWSMYSYNGLGYQRLLRVVQYLQNTLHFGYFNLKEPYSGCSFLRRVMTTNRTALIQDAKMILSYPIADLLEYSGSFGLCSVVVIGDGSNPTDTVAYRLLTNVLVSISGMEETQFCDFLGAQHSNEEYLAQGMVMAENLFNIVADENVCGNFVTVLAGEDIFHMLYNLTGMNLTLEADRAAFCAHVVSSFSTNSSFNAVQYILTSNLATWKPFSIPGQILPQFSFANVTSLIGAIYSAPTLLKGAGLLCDVFKNALLQDPEMQFFDIEGICHIIKAVDGAALEGLCLNLTVPSYYGWDYPTALRPVNTDFVGMSILLRLLGTTDLSTQNFLCPAVDMLFNSEMNLPGITDIIFHAWLRELLPTAAGFCSNWDQIVWYLSPTRHAQIFDSYIGRYTNWTIGTSEETAMAQAMYEHAVNTVTNLLTTILGFEGRESMCQFIQSSIDPSTGQVHDEVVNEVKDRLFSVLYEADLCSYAVTSLIQLMKNELGLMYNDTFHRFTGFHTPEELCGVVTIYLSEEEEECIGEMDCYGVCNGTAILDCEGTCGGKANLDCAGVCNGDAIISNCTNECVGGTTRIPEIAGRDVCGLCTLDPGYESPLDCANVCFGIATVDQCGECSGGSTGVTFNAERIDCSGQCDGSAYLDCSNQCITAGQIGLTFDQCGECGGSDECLGCDGEPNSGLENDACGVCGGTSLACVYGIDLKAMEAETENELLVDGNFNAELSHQCSLLAEDGTSFTFDMTVVDAQTGSCIISLGVGNYEMSVVLASSVAGTELLDGQSLTLEVWSACTEPVDCEGVCGGSAVLDCFEVCGGSAVADCDGECGGPLVYDCASVCGGDAVADCDGICNGATPMDCTGTCNGDAVEDCSGVCQGSATINECGYCVGGTTGRSDRLGYDLCDNCVTDPDYIDVRDCYGTCNGDAYVDDCGDCVGGESGLTSTAEDRIDCRGVCDGGWQIDSCNFCEPPSSNTVSIYADCNGDCHLPGNVDRAYINDCNYCVGGNTGLGDSHGLDACGVCDGGNSTCTGCDGVVLSGAVEDACGVCQGTGASCQVVGTVDQQLVQVGVETEMTVFGAGFVALEQYTCSLSGSETVTSEMTVVSLTEGICTFTLPSAGGYVVSVIVNGETLSVQDDAVLTVYAYSGISLTSIDPEYGLVSSESTTFTLSANSGAFAAVKTLGLTPYINLYLAGSSRVFSRIAASFGDDDDSTLSFSHTAARSAEVTLMPFVPGIGELTTDGLPVTIYAPSPQLMELYFNNRGSSIIAGFDSAAKATVFTSCSDVIVDTASLGESAFCQWISPYMLEIIVGSGSDLVSVGDTLVFYRQNIVALYETYPFPEEDGSTFSMTVSAPEVTPPVAVTLYGPSVISSCGMIKVVLQSQGAAGRELTNQWTVTSDGDTTLVTAALEALTEKNLEVNGSLISVDTDYTFHVTVTNFLEGSAEASLTLRRSSLPTPDLLINALLVDSDNALVSQSFILQADVFFSDCVPPGATAYLWSVDDESVVLSLKRNSRRLFVAANSLPGGKTITFTVVAYKESDPSNVAEESIAITTQYSDLKAVITQGQHITVGQDSGPLDLDGSMSYDPDDVPVDEVYEWQCEQHDSDMPDIQITDNTACWSYKSGHVGETILENADPTNAILTFDAAHLSADKIYIFSLVYRKSTRSATASIYVSPVAGAPPKVSITPLTDSSVSSAQVLVLKANIEHSSTLSSIEWSTTDTDSGNGYVDLTDSSNFVSRPSVLTVSDTRTFCFMALERDVLVPGSTYRFQLAVATEDNKTSEATIEVKVRNIVTSCVISLEDGSSSYTELETITISIDGCTTDEEAYPLTYQLLMARSDGTYTTMTTADSSDRIPITGPTAELSEASTNYNIFVAKVCDRYQSCSEVELNLPVNVAVFTPAEVATAVETLVSVEEQKQNYQKALSNLNILVDTLGDSQVTNSITTSTRRRKRAADTSETNAKRLELASVWMDTSDMGIEEAEVLINQHKSYNVHSSSQTYLETLVDQYQASVDVFTQDGSAVPESSSDAILEKLEAMKTRVPSSSGRIRGKISNLTEALVKTQFRALSLGGEERKTESTSSKIILKRGIPSGRMTFDSDFHFDVGEDIKNRFGSSWACSSGSCDGVTFKYQAYNDSVDEFSQTDEDIANRVAAIIEITLFDPDSDDELTVSDLSEAACFNMSLTRTEDSSQYQCRYWDSTNSEWSDSGITSESVGSLLVTCCTYHLSTFTVLLSDITTQSPTHTSHGPSPSGGDDSTSSEESQTTEENPPPAYRGNGAVIGIVVGVIVLVVIVAAIVGLVVFIKMKNGSNKVDDDHNFEAGRAVPPPLPPPSASPRPADPPVAFETAQPVAVPLRGELNMPPPPSVFVPPGEEATVVTDEEGKPPTDPHRPDRAPDSESLNSAGSAMNETSDSSQDSLPEPST